MMNRRFMIGMLLLGSAVTTQAAEWAPAQPLRIIVHTAPGGGADLFARQVADIIRQGKLLAVPVEIVNAAGGGGAVAINLANEKRGDASYLMCVTNVLLTTPLTQKNLPTYKDFVPVAAMAHDTNAVHVFAGSPHKTINELIEAARRQPSTLTHGSGAFGGTDHIIAFQLGKATGTQFRYVVFKGGGDATVALLGGHIDFVTGNPSETRAHVDSGKLRVLAIIGDKRLPVFPDVPTLKELGYSISVGTGRGFAMPAGVSRDAAAAMESALKRVHESAAWKEYSARQMLEDNYLNGAEFTQYLIKLRKEWQGFMSYMGHAARP